MAGIFNLVSDISERERGQLAKPLARSKTLLEPSSVSLKSTSLLKPKGLSVRSNSEINILASPHTNNAKSDTNIKEQGLRKKKEVVESKKAKLQKSNEYCFKRPLSPKQRTKSTSFPEPEKLAHYYDFESAFRNVSNINLENELKELLNRKQKVVKPFQDEGFESDPEPCASPNIPLMSLPFDFSDSMLKEDEIPDLPSLSDNELLA